MPQQQIATPTFNTNLRARASALLSVGCLLATLTFVNTACAQTFTVLYNFTGGQDGGVPLAGLARDAAGNLYGTTFQNGTHDTGTVFRLSPRNNTWVFAPLYEFTGGTDGGWPTAKPTIASDGTLYGTTLGGGLNDSGCPGDGYQGCGVVYHLVPRPSNCPASNCPWIETVVYSFLGVTDGWNPLGEVVFSQGAIYGTTNLGGTGTSCYGGCGTVFKLTNSGGHWSETQVHSFVGGSDGAYPTTGIVFDNDVLAYGTTYNGGGGINCQLGCGTVFSLTPSSGGWTESVLYAFQNGSDGAGPWGGVIIGSSGDVYGTNLGEPLGACGLAYQLTPSGGNWTFNTIADLPLAGCGIGPFAGLVMDASGNLYGTTYNGGTLGLGAVFKLTPSGGGWTYTSLHDFSGQDGELPEGGLVLDSSGNIYGTASAGGTSGGDHYYRYPIEGCGVIFEITP
jgi:uncharacterized repeat protein (TIGR03803 family)